MAYRQVFKGGCRLVYAFSQREHLQVLGFAAGHNIARHDFMGTLISRIVVLRVRFTCSLYLD